MKPPLRQGAPDDFQTPPEALGPLLPYLSPQWTIWEPACGLGYLVDGLEVANHIVTASDLHATPSRNFLSWEPGQWDCIVTNPPYSLKQQFLARAYSFGKPFALLLPLTTLETSKRQRLFRQHGIQLILFDRRINFRTPSGLDGKGSSSWFATAWFTWGLLPNDLTFAEWPTKHRPRRTQ